MAASWISFLNPKTAQPRTVDLFRSPGGTEVQLYFDDVGWNGAGISVGPGGGLSVSMGKAEPVFTLLDFDNYLDRLSRAIENELIRNSR